MKNTNHYTDAEKVAWYAQVWRQADKEAIADKHSGLKQQAEYWARRQLRTAIDDALRHAARRGAAANANKIAWRGHVSRQANTGNVRKQRGKYRARRQPRRAAGGAMLPANRPALLAPLLARCEVPRMPRRRVIIS